MFLAIWLQMWKCPVNFMIVRVPCCVCTEFRGMGPSKPAVPTGVHYIRKLSKRELWWIFDTEFFPPEISI